MRRQIALALALVAVGVAIAVLATRPRPIAYAPGPVARGRTNLVVVIGCTLRADQTTPYGGPDTTPFLGRLAAGGARFTDAIANAPWTKAGTTSIVTGRYAIDLAVNAPGERDDQRLPDPATTLAERFRDAGYRTVGATANPNANAIFGFDQGFDHYFEATGLWREREVKVAGTVVVDDVLAHLPADGPFYAQVMLVDAHFPYDAGADATPWRLSSPSARVAQYRAMLGRLDGAIAALYDGIAARGLAEDTVFVVIGDHGEGLYLPEHHGKAHGFYLYPSAVHVPWLIAGPGIGAGRVVDGIAQQIDLQPTLIGLFDLPPDPNLPGRDLSDLLGSGGTTGTTRAFVDTWFRNANRAAVYTPERMCQIDFDPEGSARREARAKGAPPFPTACFDRRADPEMRHPIEDPALTDELRAWRAARLDTRAAFVTAHGEPIAIVDDPTHQALKGLGYLE